MSKQSEKQTETKHRQRAGEPDLDGEHDADTARRASNAQLRAAHRRVAEAPPKRQDAKTNTAPDLHDRADQAAYEALYTNIDLLAKRMHDGAGAIDGIINWKGDDGGTDKKLEMIRAQYRAINSQTVRLRFEMANVKLGGGRRVGRDLQILHGGFLAFKDAMSRAEGLAGADGLGRDYGTESMKQEISMMHDHFGLSMKESSPIDHDVRIDDPELDLEAAAALASIGSIEASIQAVRAALTAGTTLGEDTGKLIAAVGETKTFLDNISPARIGKLTRLQQALHDLEPIERALASKPQLAQQLSNAAFPQTLSSLRSWVKQHH